MEMSLFILKKCLRNGKRCVYGHLDLVRFAE